LECEIFIAKFFVKISSIDSSGGSYLLLKKFLKRVISNINSEIFFPKFKLVVLGCAQEKEKGEEGGKEGEEECTSCKNDQEVVFIQDLGFTVKVAAPGVEPFDIQVSSLENVTTQ
jgi:hypothetical protein